MSIAEGVIVGWPGSPASIPSGWSRVPDLDGRYPRGVDTAGTDPGDTGGASTHSHSTAGHSHSLTHSHSTSANTGSPSSTVQRDTGSGAAGVSSGHTHSRPNTGSRTVSSATTAPGTSAVSNDPAHETMIWIESDGTPDVFPSGSVTLTGQAIPAGWSARPGGRYLKGADAGDDGGEVGAGVTSHSHTVSSHTHGGASHNHPSGTTNTRSGTIALDAGTLSHGASHHHNISVHSANTDALSSATGGSSGSGGGQLPPFLRLSAITAGSDRPLVPGLIALWLRSLSEIPQGWRLCDGTGGTPDLLGRFPRTAGSTGQHGDTGGTTAGHSHTGGSHGHSTSGHNHSSSTSGPVFSGFVTNTSSGSRTVSSGTHIHSLSSTGSATPTVDSSGSGTLASTATLPPWRDVAFIMLMSPGDLPPDAPTLHPRSGFDAEIAVNFEWTFEDPDLPVDNQSAYQLQILNSGGAVIYDTGKVASGDSMHILPASTLSNGQSYTWRVKTWDDNDNEGPYSALSGFSTSAPVVPSGYNPRAPLVLGQEWVPIKEEPYRPSEVLERGYTFLASEDWETSYAKVFVNEAPTGLTIAHAPIVSIYPQGMESMSGPVRRVVAPISGSEVSTGSVVYTNVPSGLLDRALRTSGDGSSATLTADGGSDTGTLRLRFAVGDVSEPADPAGSLVGKRILGVNLLYHAYGTWDQVNAATDRSVDVSLQRSGVDKWTYVGATLSGTLEATDGAAISRFPLGAINPFWDSTIDPRDDPIRMPFDSVAVSWFGPGVGSGSAITVDVDWDSLVDDEDVTDSVTIDYAALEIIYCEETRAAFGAMNVGLTPAGASTETGRAMVSYEADQPVLVHLLDTLAFTQIGIITPFVMQRGVRYTVVVAMGAGSMTPDLPSFRALRQLRPLRTHTGVEVQIETRTGRVFTREIVDVLPQISLHTDEQVIPDSHVYGLQTPGVVLSDAAPAGGPVQQGILDLSTGEADYPQVRFWARRRGTVLAPLLLRNVAQPAIHVSVDPVTFDALPEIVDGWRQVDLRFDPPQPSFDGANAAPGGAGAVEYNAPGADTYTVPAGVDAIMVETWGAGGGGSEPSTDAGAGGGGGGYARSVVAVTPLDVLDLTVGAGGAAGAGGGNSTFETTIVVADAGAAGSTGTGGAGGATNTGDVTVDGGDGGNRQSAAGGGGGGGGSGSAYIPGGDGDAGAAGFGGEGGDGEGPGGRGGAIGGDASSGWHPGGGGGGRGAGAGDSGGGGDGRVRITAMPSSEWEWRVDGYTADAQWEILAADADAIGLDPATYGGAAAHMRSSEVEHLGADAALMFSRDMEVVTGLAVEIAEQDLSVLDPHCPDGTVVPQTLLFHRLTWDPLIFGHEVALFGLFEVARQDDTMPDTDWEVIARGVSPFVGGFDDYEARVGVESRYRIRACNEALFCGPWATSVASTLTSPGVTGAGCTQALMFTSNEDPAMNLAYIPVWQGSPVEASTYPEAAERQLRRHFNRDYQTALRPTERGGEQFSRQLVVNASAVPTETLRDGFVNLRDLAWHRLPYVCVRTEGADRWLANVNVPDAQVRRPARLYMASVLITEVTATPAPVEVDACEGMTSSTANLPEQAVWAYAPDPGQVAPDGDFTIEAELRLPAWERPEGQEFLIFQKFDPAEGVGISFLIVEGALHLNVDDDAANSVSVTSTEQVPFGVAERGWVRVQFEASDGAGASQATFSYSSDGESWTALGSTVAGDEITGSVVADATTTLGGLTAVPGLILLANDGTTIRVRVRDDITGGPEIASPNFEAQDPGTTRFTDDTGVEWIVTGGGTCSIPFGGTT